MIHDEYLAANWRLRNTVGLTNYLGQHLVLKDLPKYEDHWNELEETIVLIHELGHLMGAYHTDDPTSIMYPTIGALSVEFDAPNRSIIDYSKNHLLTPHSRADLAQLIAKIASVTDSAEKKKSGFIEAISQLTFRYLDQYGETAQLQAIIDDPSIYHTLLGYYYYRFGNLEAASVEFEAAIECDPNFSLPYLYLGYIYDSLDEPSKRDHYLERARAMGYTLQ